MHMYGISNSSAMFSPNLALLRHLIEEILSKMCQSTENTKSLLFRPDALYGNVRGNNIARKKHLSRLVKVYCTLVGRVQAATIVELPQ